MLCRDVFDSRSMAVADDPYQVIAFALLLTGKSQKLFDV
jgi:hypothetical protein